MVGFRIRWLSDDLVAVYGVRRGYRSCDPAQDGLYVGCKREMSPLGSIRVCILIDEGGHRLNISRHWFTENAHHLPATPVIMTLLATDVQLQGAVDSASILEPAGPAAAAVTNLWWWLFGLAALIYLFVMGLLLWSLLRPNRQPNDDDVPPKSYKFVLLSGVAMPAVVLTGVFALDLLTVRVLSPPPGTDAPLSIDVTGHQWWWEVEYPEHGVVTANELHIPSNLSVRLDLTSDDVIHSFWAPELQGKIDLMPGQVNTLWLHADQAGVYQGICAEYCGIQHAKMLFLVVVHSPEDFETWLTQQSQPAPEPVNAVLAEGQAVFMRSGCSNCHRVAGTQARGDLGPDLTHFASRRTIGSGAVPNVRGHLAGWIIDSQSIKPGNLMPPMSLDGTELQPLLAYLESLE